MKLSDRVIVLALALVFVLSGGAKLAGLDFEIEAFQRWGYPLWFMYATGAVEVLGAILLLLPRSVVPTAALLAAFMVGAVGTHAIHAEWGMLAVAMTIHALLVRHAWRTAAQTRSAANPTPARPPTSDAPAPAHS